MAANREYRTNARLPRLTITLTPTTISRYARRTGELASSSGALAWRACSRDQFQSQSAAPMPAAARLKASSPSRFRRAGSLPKQASRSRCSEAGQATAQRRQADQRHHRGVQAVRGGHPRGIIGGARLREEPGPVQQPGRGPREQRDERPGDRVHGVRRPSNGICTRGPWLEGSAQRHEGKDGGGQGHGPDGSHEVRDPQPRRSLRFRTPAGAARDGSRVPPVAEPDDAPRDDPGDGDGGLALGR